MAPEIRECDSCQYIHTGKNRYQRFHGSPPQKKGTREEDIRSTSPRRILGP